MTKQYTARTTPDIGMSKGDKKAPPKQKYNASQVNDKGNTKSVKKSGNGGHVVSSASNPFVNALAKGKK